MTFRDRLEYWCACNPCFICAEGNVNPLSWCAHRERDVIRAELAMLDRELTALPTRRAPGVERRAAAPALAMPADQPPARARRS